MADAGYQVEPVTTTSPTTPGTPAPDNNRGQITKDGEPPTLVLGVAANSIRRRSPSPIPPPTNCATSASRPRCRRWDPVALYGDALTNNRVDAVVGWHQAGGDLATALASRYGCPALEATAVSTATPGPMGTSSAVAHASRPPAIRRRRGPPPRPRHRPRRSRWRSRGELVQAPSNITGICDRSIQQEIDAALDGAENVAA